VTILYEPRSGLARAARESLPGQPVRVAADLAALTGLLAEDPDEVLVVLGPGVDLAGALPYVASLRVSRPALGLVLVREQVDTGTLNAALQAGIREVVPVETASGVASIADDLSAACQRSLQLSAQLRATTRATAGAGSPAAAVFTVFAGKGGCGKSTVATNLAVTLAGGGRRRVCLIDLDLAFGDVAIMLQLTPARTLVDAVAMGGRLDETGLRSLLTPYRPGLDALLAPAGPTEAEAVTPELVADVLGLARSMFDYVVVDNAPQFTGQSVAALDAADRYVLLTTPDVPTLKNLRLALDVFAPLGYRREDQVVVLNRSDSKVGLTDGDIERVVRGQIDVRVPSSRDVPVSVNRGVPLALEQPNHPVSKAVRSLAERLAGPAPAGTAGTGDGLPPPAPRRRFGRRAGDRADGAAPAKDARPERKAG
jgi:pilus assembly protein CpaE